MQKIRITVEETLEDVNGNEEVRECVMEQDYNGCIEDVTEMFRSILYWLSFVPGTINSVISDRETIEEGRNLAIASVEKRMEENEDCGCDCCECDGYTEDGE